MKLKKEKRIKRDQATEEVKSDPEIDLKGLEHIIFLKGELLITELI